MHALGIWFSEVKYINIRVKSTWVCLDDYTNVEKSFRRTKTDQTWKGNRIVRRFLVVERSKRHNTTEGGAWVIYRWHMDKEYRLRERTPIAYIDASGFPEFW